MLQPIFTFEETSEEDGRIKGKWLKHTDLRNTEKLLAAGNFQKREGNYTDEKYFPSEPDRDVVLC